MHLLITHAAPSGSQCQATIKHLKLPNLSELLGLLTACPPMLGSPDMLTPLSERMRANSLGLQGPDGLIPWAAMDAQQLGLTKTHGDAGWAWITPCHLKVQTSHVEMKDPADLHLSTPECEALRAAMEPYFAEDGITLHPLSNGTWLAYGSVFKDLPTASLERVTGSSVDPWMPQSVQAKPLRKLQNEMQMLLYTHPVNDARSARGETTVNAFWISATGTPTAANANLPEAPTAGAKERIHCVDTLRHAALQDDGLAWQDAWEEIDRTVLADLLKAAKSGKSLELTLCDERMAVTLELQNKPWWSRIQQCFPNASPLQLLQSL